LDTDDFEYIDKFQENPFDIHFKKGNISFENDCFLELSSVNQGNSEIFRIRNNYSKGYNYPLQSNMFFVFSNETKINNIFNRYIDHVSQYIRITVTIYIVAMVTTVINNRKQSVFRKNTGSPVIPLPKMRTIKELESEIDESKPLTFRKDENEVKKEKESDFLFKATSKMNNSNDSEVSNNVYTEGKEEKQENNIIIKKEEIEENKEKESFKQIKVTQSIPVTTKSVNEEEKDELDEIIELLRNNSEHFALNFNFEKILFKESVNHKLFDGFFKENIKLQEFLLKKTPVLLEEKYYEYFHNRQFIFEFFQIECFEFDMKYRNFLFKFDDMNNDINTFRLDSNSSFGNILNEKRKEFYSRINDYILYVYYDEGEANEYLKRDKLDSAISYYIDNILSKWIKKINDYNKLN